MHPLPAQSFGALLRHHRLAAGLTQEALAERAQISVSAINTLERGTRRAPHNETVRLLSQALALSDAERTRFEAAARWRGAPITSITSVTSVTSVTATSTITATSTVAAGRAGALEPEDAPAREAAPHAASDLAGMPDRPQPAARWVLLRPPNIKLPVPMRARIQHWSSRGAALLLGLLLVISVVAAQGGPGRPSPIRGGIWTDALQTDPTSLIPNGGGDGFTSNMLLDQALYLPLFYGDAHGELHPGAARDLPTLANGGINRDATVWTFHLRPGLVWSDGQPYDARDVDYTWKLWADAAFGGDFPLANGPAGYQQIQSATVSADHRSITFHLRQPDAGFLLLWVDGVQAPLPAHHFSALAPSQVQQSADDLNPLVTSGPFRMAESQPSDHYTLVRNARYYLAGAGRPYLDQLIFRIGSDASILQHFQAGAADSTQLGKDLVDLPAYQGLSGYQLITAPTSAQFEALFFNFHNLVLATHREVREAIVRAIDQRALIAGPLHGLATPLCTDHPSALHPGYQPNAYCPAYGLAAANKELDDAGWMRGADGVRAKAGQRLEFEYSTALSADSWRDGVQVLVQQDLRQIGIQLDVQNYPGHQFFNTILASGQASPPTGAVAGRFDIAEYGWGYTYDADDSVLLACNQVWPGGFNFGSYCSPTLDALFQQELATPDPGLRQNLFDQMHQIYVTDLPFITLFSPLSVTVVRRRTHNDAPSPIVGETSDVWDWWCDQGRC